MFESAKFATLQSQALIWFQTHIWNVGTVTQIFILGFIFVLSMAIHHFTDTRLTNAINGWQLPPRIKQVFHNLRRLLIPLTALGLVFFVKVIEVYQSLPGEGDLIVAAMRLLLAWIVIRLASQLIDNRFVQNLVTLVVWGIAALSILGILDETSATLDSLGMTIGNLRISALTVIKGLFALFALLYGAIFLSSIAEKKVLQVSSLTVSSRVLLAKILRITLIVFALLIGIASAGIDLSLLAVFSGALGLGLGFGLQKGMSNLFSGFLLLMDKSITPGDIIELPNGAFGWVQHMGARYTEIITRDNKSFLIPNEDFITHQVVNWSHGDTLIRLETKFGVHHHSDPHLVKRIAEEVTTKPERVVDNPMPQCHLVDFGESSLNFVLRYWIKDAEKGVTNVRGEVMLALWDAFRENGIKIPYPQRIVHMTPLPDNEK